MEDIHTVTAKRLFGTSEVTPEMRQLVKIISLGKMYEAEIDGCPGWKYPDGCPPKGKFDSSNQACRECEEDALKAMADI